MKTLSLLILGCLLVGCIGGSRSRLNERAALRADAGPADVQLDGIVLIDSSPPDSRVPDRSVMPDFSVPDESVPDADIVPQLCRYEDTEGLVGPNCFPRCDRETLDQIMQCQDEDCFNDAIENDPSPPGTALVDNQVIDLFCADCFQLQQFSCIAEACPAEYEQFFDCRDNVCGGDDACAQLQCREPADQLNECLNRTPDIQECAQRKISRCFFG